MKRSQMDNRMVPGVKIASDAFRVAKIDSDRITYTHRDKLRVLERCLGQRDTSELQRQECNGYIVADKLRR